MAAIGAGVGVPLGLLFLTFLALYVLEKRKNNHMERQRVMNGQLPVGRGSGPGSMYEQGSMYKPQQAYPPAELKEDRAGRELVGSAAALSELSNAREW